MGLIGQVSQVAVYYLPKVQAIDGFFQVIVQIVIHGKIANDPILIGLVKDKSETQGAPIVPGQEGITDQAASNGFFVQ